MIQTQLYTAAVLVFLEKKNLKKQKSVVGTKAEIISETLGLNYGNSKGN